MVEELVDDVVGFEVGGIREVIPGRFRCRGGEFDWERDRERLRLATAGAGIDAAAADNLFDAATSTADFAGTSTNASTAVFAGSETLFGSDAFDDVDPDGTVGKDVAFAGDCADTDSGTDFGASLASLAVAASGILFFVRS